jgi:hypothetical protein
VDPYGPRPLHARPRNISGQLFIPPEPAHFFILPRSPSPAAPRLPALHAPRSPAALALPRPCPALPRLLPAHRPPCLGCSLPGTARHALPWPRPVPPVPYPGRASPCSTCQTLSPAPPKPPRPPWPQPHPWQQQAEAHHDGGPSPLSPPPPPVRAELISPLLLFVLIFFLN